MKRIHSAITGLLRTCGVAALALLLAGFATAGLAADSPMPAWATTHVSVAMCQGSKMHLMATGTVAVVYERVYTVLMATNILEVVAKAYQRELPANAKTNLVVIPVDANGRYTVDWKDERADVHDLVRRTDTNNFFEGGFIITGVRYFGAFESVMTLHVQRTPAGQADFRADVLIYPHNGLIRFVFNNLISVESYFRVTMNEMSAEITRVCTSLCQSDNVPAVFPPR